MPESAICPHLEGCPVFAYFRSYVKQVYIDMYCQGEYECCARRKLRVADEEVPKDLLPTGFRLYQEGG
jgi:hypothetical protein